nr:DUF2182 domain-containing protein [Rhodovulum robiginosum]
MQVRKGRPFVADDDEQHQRAVRGGAVAGGGDLPVTPIKQTCLRHCRNPKGYFARHWRPGAAGALRMGLDHGRYCICCCWSLIALLFFGGVMNLYWIILLAVLVLAEKLLASGRTAGMMTGAVLIA